MLFLCFLHARLGRATYWHSGTGTWSAQPPFSIAQLCCPVRGSHPWQSLKPVGPDVEIFYAGCWTWCHVSWCGPGTSDEYAGGLFLYAQQFPLLRKQKSGGSLVTAPSPDWVNLLPDSWNLMLRLSNAPVLASGSPWLLGIRSTYVCLASCLSHTLV